VELLSEERFVPNDTKLDSAGRLMILTGPNMAGKSTYMRQAALIVIMAQIGSFVPAKSAEIGVCDRVFTRVGASDDILSGQSTFMVEMSEVANILNNATKNSLIVLDEIGRGTSTYDGLSIAWAVLEHIADPARLGAKTLFATHYHELTELEGRIGGVFNAHTAVKESGGEIIFLRKIKPGGAGNSYGVQVARLAGLPESVLKRADSILSLLDEADVAKAEGGGPHEGGGVRYGRKGETVSTRLIFKEIMDIDENAPFAAIDQIRRIKRKLSGFGDVFT
jgi:DNA mismatch repair protein MutS